MKNQNRVVTRSMIANALWESETSQYTNVIDVFISHLRKKLDVGTNRPRLLHTIRGKGFRLTDQLDPDES
jgi:two-component system, OmpR family, response regulator